MATPSGGVGRSAGVLAWRGHASLLATQQMSAGDEQIGQRAGHQQAMRVLFEPAIAHLGKAEHPLDDPDPMLDFGPHLRFGAGPSNQMAVD